MEDRHEGGGAARVLIGNKCDVEAHAVPRVDAEALAARHGMAYFETSAKTGANVEELFATVARELYIQAK